MASVAAKFGERYFDATSIASSYAGSTLGVSRDIRRIAAAIEYW